MKVTILHNTDRDASFGLNTRLEPGKQITQPRSHQLVRVFQFEQPEDYLQHVLEDVYWRLNVGEDPDFGEPDQIALDYRALRLRSLSIGDVVQIEDGSDLCPDGYYALDRFEFKPVAASQLAITTTR